MILDVLTFPDSRLKKKALPVKKFGEELRNLSQDLFETMYAKNGIGLAATQVGVQQRIIVIHLRLPDQSQSNVESLIDESNPITLVNPSIKESKGLQVYEEACLSVPEFSAKIERHEDIVVEYQTVEGEQKELSAAGLFSVCIQHELDHLEGILFIDHLPPFERKILQKRLKKKSIKS